MKSILLILLSYTILFVSCEEKDNECKREVTYYDTGEKKNKFCRVDSLVEGEVKTYYKSGVLLSTTSWRKGLRHGKNQFYYETGELKEISSSFKGVSHGDYKRYYKSGVLKEKGEFCMDVVVGDFYSYYKNGNLKSIGHSINLKGKQYTSGQIYYDSLNGEVVKNIDFVERVSESDTVTLGEDFKLRIELKDLGFTEDSSYLVLANYADDFTLDSSSLIIDTIGMPNHRVTLLETPKDTGTYYFRGYVFYFGKGKRKYEDGSIEEVDVHSFPIYFEHRFYVKP